MTIERIDHETRVISRLAHQFSESERLQGYLLSLISEANDLEDVFQDLCNLRSIDTATGAQLDIIGAIVGQSRETIDASAFEYFGFDPNVLAFGFGDDADAGVGGRFRGLNEPVAGTRLLTDAEYRIYIRAKIISNSTRSTIDDILFHIKFIFGIEQVSLDNGDREYTVNILEPIDQTSKAILQTTNIVPKTLAVAVTYTFV